MDIIKFDKKLTCGPDFVAVRIIENCEELKLGNIWLTSSSNANERLAFAQIEDIGEIASKEKGLKIGDYVLIDRLATFAHTAPVAALKHDSVICKTNSTNTEPTPLRNMAFVEPDDKSGVSKVGNIYVDSSKYLNRLITGTITKCNFDEELKLPFKSGNKVILTKGADHVQFGEIDIFIYKHDMIVATIED